MARAHGSQNAPTQVKVAAVRLVRSGMTQAAVAGAFGVDPSTVSRWRRLARSGGANALAPRPVSGRPPKLSRKDLGHLAALLKRPPEAFGLRGPRWTASLAADLIRKMHGVHYHPSHVWRLLRVHRARS